ncbi:O-antigen ligase family protein [Paenibacillus sp. LjRoot153]|uniref:O-antigen ligase family protein n=1 Tax=Paenibacillus sp. LjRoot153 TaxID=3342270 RepID=UPI003ECF46BC
MLGQRIFAVILLFFSTEAVFPLLRSENGFNISVFREIEPLLWITFYVIALVLVIKKTDVFETLMKNKLILILMLEISLSSLWSSVPETSVVKSLFLIGTLIVGLFLATFSKKEIINFLIWTSSLCVILSIFFILFFPQYAIQPEEFHNNAWRGIFSHKNILGRVMVMSILSWSVYGYQNKKIFIPFIFIVSSLALLIKSQSQTSISLLLILALVFPLVTLFRKERILAISILFFLLSIVTALTFLFLQNAGKIAALLGRDLTLTGRTDLWIIIWEMIMKNPILGYGYSGFWQGMEGPSSVVWDQVTWHPVFSHNGYLEVLLQTGFVGMLIFTMSFLKNIVLARNERFYFLLLLFILVYNCFESTLILPNIYYWILYLTITYKMSSHNKIEGIAQRRYTLHPNLILQNSKR